MELTEESEHVDVNGMLLEFTQVMITAAQKKNERIIE
jgi:hypothetical protein